MILSIFDLAARLVELQSRAEALGLFMDDRELIQCESCGLHEDVTAVGELIISTRGSLGDDSGLRFEALSEHAFRCPQCGEILLVSDSMQRLLPSERMCFIGECSIRVCDDEAAFGLDIPR